MSSCSCKLSNNDLESSETENSEKEVNLLSKLIDTNLNFEEHFIQYPEIKKFVDSLFKYIDRQDKKIRKIRRKLEKYKQKIEFKIEKHDVCTQYEVNDESIVKSIVDDITEAATNVVQETGFVYEATSGLYYDYKTGYYYNAEYGLYYDGNTGIYYKYNEHSHEFEFHSKVELPETSSETEVGTSAKRKEKIKDREDYKRVKHGDEDTTEVIVDPTTDDERSSGPVIIEEGECTNSSDSDNDDQHVRLKKNNDEVQTFTHAECDLNDEEISKAWPPCMRIIVQETSLEKLQTGTLFVITCDGGSMGREGNHSILIPDINVSKHHATFTFNRDTSHYMIVDLGSRNGTLLDGKRLSVAKQESDPTIINHGAIIQVGATKLLCHIHSGNETCGDCEPGLYKKVISAEPKLIGSNTNKNEHKTELKRLKKKFGIDGFVIPEVKLPDGYQDRAQTRREKVGSINHNAKTETASIHQTISSENKGFRLLKGMGWTEGSSLGKDGTGITQPIPLVSNVGHSGLGSVEPDIPVRKLSKKEKKKEERWRKMHERFQNIPTNEEEVLNEDSP
ncbi:angiogenic factor with G patch and FHA domains 1 isoform X1 [Chrysoperla carnea]|uniref:angiogenic factor with G patch and FHA domains 1 isoform X1 n=1 Tax=Chrysoperla carnea TaxID=189513 RepID=UPI001D06D367|nr:angiogenic factor with G patch and FHA domains 1 isoform X1 [Chrysoperla carnea]